MGSAEAGTRCAALRCGQVCLEIGSMLYKNHSITTLKLASNALGTTGTEPQPRRRGYRAAARSLAAAGWRTVPLRDDAAMPSAPAAYNRCQRCSVALLQCCVAALRCSLALRCVCVVAALRFVALPLCCVCGL